MCLEYINFYGMVGWNKSILQRKLSRHALKKADFQADAERGVGHVAFYYKFVSVIRTVFHSDDVLVCGYVDWGNSPLEFIAC